MAKGFLDFKELSSKEVIATYELQAAIKKEQEKHDATRGSMSFLRKAIDAPTISEVLDMIHTEIIDYNCLSKLELKVGEVTKVLEDTPRHFLFPEILTS